MANSMYHVGIIGLGQIGGSIAAALKRNGAPYRLLGHDADINILRLAMRRRIVQHAHYTEGDLIDDSDVIVLALPMFEIHRMMREHRMLFEKKILVIDTGSTKEDVIATANRLGMNNFVGGHPYAGTEKAAPAGWDSMLFSNQLFFIVPPRGCRRKSYSEALRLIRYTGASAKRIDPENHDRMFAFASGLPHIIAYALVASQSDRRRKVKIDGCFLAHSFASSTRVARSPAETVAQFLWQNRKHLRREIGILKDKLDVLLEQLSMRKIDSFLDTVVRSKGMKENLG